MDAGWSIISPPCEYTNSNDKRVTIFMHDITDRIQQEELEREKIAAELHEVVSEMLESHENSRVGFRDKLKGKSLTPREMEVLKEVASGLSTKQISIKHQVSTKTIESQRLSIMRKLSIFNIADLTKYAIKSGIISLDEWHNQFKTYTRNNWSQIFAHCTSVVLLTATAWTSPA